MAWPYGFLLNRKSRLGHRPLARTPRHHRRAWFTTPPIADDTEDTMTEPIADETLAGMRRILRSLVALIAPSDIAENVDRKKTLDGMLDAAEDSRLVATAQEALSVVTKSKKHWEGLDAGLAEMRKELDRIKDEHRKCERAVADGQKAVKERDDIAAKYRELQKQIDPDAEQLRIMYAVDEATKAQKAEAAALRAELAQRQSEINELKASKRRLREALDRLAGKD